MTVELFIPCFVDQLFPQTAFNMMKVLEKAGCRVNYNTNQTCCGQPAFNAGYWQEAKEVGHKFVEDLASDNYVVAPSGSCVGFVQGMYGEMFNNTIVHNQYKKLSSNIREFSEFLVNELGVDDMGASMEGIATYHDACGALRECGIKQEPRTLLDNVKGLEIREMADVETCCGFGGTFAVKYEPISIGMADQKVENARNTGADYLISTDSSCLMHLDGYIKKRGYNIQTLHIADVLAEGW
jgi:L-lactate dehydrogenase complex protein LldE